MGLINMGSLWENPPTSLQVSPFNSLKIINHARVRRDTQKKGRRFSRMRGDLNVSTVQVSIKWGTLITLHNFAKIVMM